MTIGSGTSGVLTYPNNNNALSFTVNNDIMVNTGATLTSGTQTNAVTHLLNVGGNIANSGTLNLTGSGVTNAVTLTLNGSSANQNIGGSSTSTLNSLTINNTAGVNPGATLTGAVSVANVLTMTSGKFTL